MFLLILNFIWKHFVELCSIKFSSSYNILNWSGLFFVSFYQNKIDILVDSCQKIVRLLPLKAVKFNFGDQKCSTLWILNYQGHLCIYLFKSIQYFRLTFELYVNHLLDVQRQRHYKILVLKILVKILLTLFELNF